MSQSEAQVIASQPLPVTRLMLEQGLRNVGLGPGMIVLAHARVSAFGWIPGHAETVVHAILSVLGPDGTLMVPAFSAQLSEPSNWVNPPVPEDWWPLIRSELPVYDPLRTPTRGVGAVPEVVRTWPGARRSAHPQSSFAAIGPHAERLLSGQRLEAEFGPDSPLERLADAGGKVLFLGSDWDTATIFHLGEHRAGAWPLRRNGAPVNVDGQRRWVGFDCPDYDSDAFAACGKAFEAVHHVARSKVGAGQVVLFDAALGARFAQEWLSARHSV